MHQIFANIRDLDGKSLRALETLIYEVYAGCMRTERVQWIKSWRFVFDLMTGC